MSGKGSGPTTTAVGGQGHDHHTASHAFDLPVLPEAVDIFDTTLRDGSQQEGLSLTVDDKLRVAEQLDHLGVTFIEAAGPEPTPRTKSSSPGPRPSCDFRPPLWWLSVPPGGPASGPRMTRYCATW